MLGGRYEDASGGTALLGKDLELFLQETSEAGMQDLGLQGLAELLHKANGTPLDHQDYCALHELTQTTT